MEYAEVLERMAHLADEDLETDDMPLPPTDNPTGLVCNRQPRDFYNELSEKNFAAKLRMNKQVASEILRRIEKKISFGGVPLLVSCLVIDNVILTITSRLSTKQIFLAAVYYMAHGVSFIALEDSVLIRQGKLSYFVPKVIRTVAELFTSMITFPKSPQSMMKMETGFYLTSGLPCCLGAADGTLVRVACPYESEYQLFLQNVETN